MNYNIGISMSDPIMLKLKNTPEFLAIAFSEKNDHSYKYCFGKTNENGEVKTHNIVMRILNAIGWAFTCGWLDIGPYSSENFSRSFESKPSKDLTENVENLRKQFEQSDDALERTDSFWRMQQEALFSE